MSKPPNGVTTYFEQVPLEAIDATVLKDTRDLRRMTRNTDVKKNGQKRPAERAKRTSSMDKVAR